MLLPDICVPVAKLVMALSLFLLIELAVEWLRRRRQPGDAGLAGVLVAAGGLALVGAVAVRLPVPPFAAPIGMLGALAVAAAVVLVTIGVSIVLGLWQFDGTPRRVRWPDAPGTVLYFVAGVLASVLV